MRRPLPWFVWAFVVWFVFRTLDWHIGVVPAVVIGMIVAGVLGSSRGSRGVDPTASPTPVAEPGPPGPVLDGRLPPEGPMSTIPVPTYPGEGAPRTWSTAQTTPPPGPAESLNPAVSLGQLHLARIARELDGAVRAGDAAATDRLVGEVVEHTARLEQILQASSGPDAGRKAFLAGVRRLGGEAARAVGSDPAAPQVGALVRGAAALGQTGRYE